LGFAVAIISTGIYAFVDTSEKKENTNGKKEGGGQVSEPFFSAIEARSLVTNASNPYGSEPSESSWIDNLSETKKRALGVRNLLFSFPYFSKISLALTIGIFFGTIFDPPTYLQIKGNSQDGLDYVFSHFCGIYLTSTLFVSLLCYFLISDRYFLIYCIVKKNKPDINPEVLILDLILN